MRGDVVGIDADASVVVERLDLFGVVPGVRVHVVACVDRHVLGDLESIVVRGVIEDDVKVRCGHEAAHVTLRTVACTWENC